MPNSRSKRVLLYSHDSFGLGHVSRCRTIANALVAADPNVSVLILSGSPVIGSYEFRSGIDFVRIPGVVKQIDATSITVGTEKSYRVFKLATVGKVMIGRGTSVPSSDHVPELMNARLPDAGTAATADPVS